MSKLKKKIIPANNEIFFVEPVWNDEQKIIKLNKIPVIAWIIMYPDYEDDGWLYVPEAILIDGSLATSLRSSEYAYKYKHGWEVIEDFGTVYFEDDRKLIEYFEKQRFEKQDKI